MSKILSKYKDEGAAIRDYLFEKTGQKTVPNVCEYKMLMLRPRLNWKPIISYFNIKM